MLKAADVVGEALTRWSGWVGQLPIISPSMIALVKRVEPLMKRARERNSSVSASIFQKRSLCDIF